ncbi:MAG: RluA family pseudouridine synthase [Desulfuromonas sp.]|nr:MAG: RluA family pseudouridine synthase [Desulfuromonas sp.]
MPQNLSFYVDPARISERLDRFLAESLPDISRSQIKKLIDDGLVQVAGRPAKAGEKLRVGDTIHVTLPPPAPSEVVPQQIPLQVLYEDAHLIIIDKPAGLVVHPAPGHADGTLVNALLHHCQDLAGVGGELRPGIVHRLDKETSGVMVATKDDKTHTALAQQFKVHSIRRCYLALVHGLLPQEKGVIDCPIGRHPTQRKKMSGKSRSGRRAVTRWKVLSRFTASRISLVELTLETGRTHQIRVHLSEMNHPVVGDPVYGASGRLKDVRDPKLKSLLVGLKRQALHARLLGFVHPQDEEYREFTSALPPDMSAIVSRLQALEPADTIEHKPQ